MDMAEWLRGLGLEQYAPAFREHHIDGEVLRRLTTQDLRELGIDSIGHRRRMLDAIAALPARPPAVAAPGTAPTAARARDAEAGPTASAIANEAEGGVPSGRAPSGSGLTPLVGRDKEMRLLLRRGGRRRPAPGRWC